MANYQIRMAGKKDGLKTGEAFLYDAIGEGMFGGISAKTFAEDLNKLGNITELNVRINSPGGDVFQGLAIYNTLKRHPANVVVHIDGMALSIASVIAMSGDEIRMAGNAMFMIHNPAAPAFGTAEDLRARADLLDQVKENLVNTYAARTALRPDELSKMMENETWMDATKAKALGFVDTITEDLQMAASFDLSQFRNAPKTLQLANSEAPRSNIYRAKIALMRQRVLG